MGPGALLFWLQRENTLFHVRVNAAVEALPGETYRVRDILISVKRWDWELCAFLRAYTHSYQRALGAVLSEPFRRPPALPRQEFF
eukprot:scaffold293043_cov71-Attheya_sp.AAC.1